MLVNPFAIFHSFLRFGLSSRPVHSASFSLLRSYLRAFQSKAPYQISLHQESVTHPLFITRGRKPCEGREVTYQCLELSLVVTTQMREERDDDMGR